MPADDDSTAPFSTSPSFSTQTPLDPEIVEKIQNLLLKVGADTQSKSSYYIEQLITSCLKLVHAPLELGQLKLMTRALKEMRYAYSIFNAHRIGKCVSIFGSARTPQTHPDYQMAKAFSAAISTKGWICMTGAADGIMRAGLEGATKNSSFGLSIRLPFESPSHTLLAGDPKLINFRYFFTRKLMFLSQSDAIVAFPGGVGTQDELFEALTLMQTGKANIVPIILLEGENGNYWKAWEEYIKRNLLANGWMSVEDFYLYHHAKNIEDAVQHIQHFYHRYHSSRYVKDLLVIRLLTPLSKENLQELNANFSTLIKEGEIYETLPLPEEDDHLELPRIAFLHNHRLFGLLRHLIDRINNFS